MKLGRLVIAAIGVTVLLGAVALSAGYWLLASEAGAAWIFARVESRIPPRVSIGELRGTVLTGFDLRDIVIEIGNDRLEIDAATFELDLASVIERSLRLSRLSVSAATYRRGPPPAVRSSTPFNVPIPIRIDAGTMERFVLVRDDRATELGPVALAADVDGNRIDLQDVVASALGFDLRGSGELLVEADLMIAADFAWSTVRGGLTYAGEGQASGAWPQLAFHQDMSAPIAVAADGDLTIAAQPVVEFDATWRNLVWPGFALARSPEGSAHFSGWLDAYDFRATGRVVAEGVESGVMTSGSGSPSGLAFDTLHLSGEGGDVDAVGRLDFRPLVWAFDIQTTGLNPAARLPDWPGALDVQGELSGTMSPQLELSLENMTAAGELRGQPIVATGNIGYRAPSRWQLEDLVVTVAENEVTLTGSLGETVALDVVIDARELDRLAVDLSGALHAAGHVAGTLAEPTLTGVLSGQNLRYGDFGAQTLTMSGEIVADQTRAVQLDLNAERVTVADRPVDAVNGMITGTAARHAITLELSAADASARLSASGSWLGGTWRGELTALDVDEPAVGPWSLTDAARLELGQGRVALESACLVQRETRLCGMARVGTDADALDVELSNFDLAILGPLLPTELTAAGRYDATLHLTGPLRRPAGTFDARGIDTRLSVRELDEPPLDITIESFEVTGDLSETGELTLMAALQGGAGASVAVDAEISRLWDADRTLRADVSGQWEDMRMLSLLSPDVGDVGGTASIDLTLEGPPRQPAVSGQARWLNGRVEVPRWGLVVESIDATVSSPDGTRLLWQASGLAGEGRVDVSGVTELDAERRWPTDLRVFGNRLQAVRLPDAEILVSPALEVHAELPNIDVSGAFLIPYARLELEGLPPQAVRPSSDTVVHGVDRPDEEHPLDLRADLRVGLGEDVRYTGAGLDVALSGAMGLDYESGRDAVASGAVSLKGTYQAYGQSLEIDQGQLLFAGPVANPNLDVRAIRRIEPGTTDIRLTETTIVGVELSGTVEAPVARIFSEPAMNEADALSYLLLGRPLSASGDQETATLESAAFTMGLQQALPVIQRVGESLGFDEFSVQTTTADTGELMAGKRISPRLYIRYTYGLFNRIGGLLMHFSLSEHFSLETRSGDYRSMDLIYTVERD